jgi:beta-lactamase regulating signal transducer with metallopeptidase domain
VWLTVIVAVLVLPIVSAITPVPVRVLPAVTLPRTFTAAQPTPSSERLPEKWSDEGRLCCGGERAASAAAQASFTSLGSTRVAAIDLARALTSLWAVMALVLSLRIVGGMMSVNRLARRGTPLVGAEWMSVLTEAARRIDVRELPRLIMSDQVEMAFAFRALSPAIILPGSAREWSRDRRRAVLLHELAHIRRRDLVTHAVAGFICAVNWFNPFIWAAARQLRIESEMASDEMVLRAGVRPSVYAQHLLEMVTGIGRAAPAVALAMARPREFEGRLVAILDPHRRRAFARNRTAVIGFVALPALAIGAVAPVPRAVTRAVSVTPRVSLELAPRPQPVEPIVATMVPAPRAASAAPRRLRAGGGTALSRDGVAMLVRFGTRAVVNPMMMLLRDADSLALSAAQADSIATLNRQYMIELNRIWAPVSAFYAARANEPTPLVPPSGADPTRATIKVLSGIVRNVDGLLTPEQRDRLSPSVRLYLDSRRLPALLASPSGGVLLSLDQFNGIRGRGRGGG